MAQEAEGVVVSLAVVGRVLSDGGRVKGDSGGGPNTAWPATTTVNLLLSTSAVDNAAVLVDLDAA